MTENIRGPVQDAEIDFPMWRVLDHTRYMIFRCREKELAEFGLTPEQAFVLDIIHAAGGSTTIMNIVRMSQRKHNTISSLVDRMAKQGLLRKTRDRKDRRAFHIRATEKGEALLKKVPRQSLHAIFSCLEIGEKQQLASLLNRVMETAYRASGMTSPYRVEVSGDSCSDTKPGK